VALTGMSRTEYADMMNKLINAELANARALEKDAVFWEDQLEKASRGRNVVSYGVFHDLYEYIPANPRHAGNCSILAKDRRRKLSQSQEKLAMLREQLQAHLATGSFDPEGKNPSPEGKGAPPRAVFIGFAFLIVAAIAVVLGCLILLT